MKQSETTFVVVRPRTSPEVYGSIKAIYDYLSPEEVGVPLYRVWGRFKDRDYLDTGKAIIYKTTVKRCKSKERRQV